MPMLRQMCIGDGDGQIGQGSYGKEPEIPQDMYNNCVSIWDISQAHFLCKSSGIPSSSEDFYFWSLKRQFLFIFKGHFNLFIKKDFQSDNK